jgi:hypothetical protein
MPIKTFTIRICAVSSDMAMILLLCLALLIPQIAKCQPSCSPSLLSSNEAKTLLNAIPQALAARHIGGKISVVDWFPGASYRTENFYFYEVLSTKSTETTPLDNGVLGYFGVNKATGQVVELNSEKPSVEAPELKRLQRRYRQAHCVGPDLIDKNTNLTIER